MQRSASILLLIALPALLAPAAVQARPLSDFMGAKLQAAGGTLTIGETRCPPGSTNCSKTKLEESFDSGARPKTRGADGQSGFPSGLRLLGKGAGTCSMESPTTTIMGPDGSVQFLGSSARYTPGSFDGTRIAVSGGKRGVRVAWLEPVAPGITCKYFDDEGSGLALPPSAQLPSELVSPTIGPRVLKRARFTVNIAGSKNWTETAADGTQVTRSASWKLRLDYVARGSSAAGRRSGAR
ncbi:MAG TPA: hypothetical protein VF066_03180 [Thermoleophilaceae bacterium]